MVRCKKAAVQHVMRETMHFVSMAHGTANGSSKIKYDPNLVHTENQPT